MVTVTKADRERAATVYCKIPGSTEQAHSRILNGDDDGHYLVQHFARHREEACQQLEAKNAKLVEALGKAFDLLTCSEIEGLARKARVRGFAPDVRKIGAVLSNHKDNPNDPE